MLKEQLLQRLSADDLDDAVRRKQDQYAGLLTEEAALRVLAHENGIPTPRLPVEFSPLATALAGSMVTAQVRVLAVLSPKRFQTGERSGRLCKIRVADSTAAADLVLWNSDVDAASGIQRNDVLCLKDVFCKIQNPLELHSRLSSELWVADAAEAASAISLPLSPVVAKSLTDLREGEEADVFARMLDKQPLKEFRRQDKAGYLSKITLSDGVKSVSAACWDENAHVAQSLEVGDAVKVEGALLRNGEINVSWSGRLLRNPMNHGLAEMASASTKTLAELDATDAPIEIRIDKVVDAQRQHKCKSCGAKSSERKEVCACGSQDFSSLVYVSLEVSDASGPMRVVLFDAAATELLGAKSSTDLNLLSQLKRDYLAGKSVKLMAYAKQSARTGQKEAVGKAVLGWKD